MLTSHVSSVSAKCSCNNGDFWNLFTSGGVIAITRNNIQYENLIAIDLHYITRSFGEDNCKTAPTGLPIARAPDKRKDIFLNLLSTPVSETSMMIRLLHQNGPGTTNFKSLLHYSTVIISCGLYYGMPPEK